MRKLKVLNNTLQFGPTSIDVFPHHKYFAVNENGIGNLFPDMPVPSHAGVWVSTHGGTVVSAKWPLVADWVEEVYELVPVYDTTVLIGTVVTKTHYINVKSKQDTPYTYLLDSRSIYCNAGHDNIEASTSESVGCLSIEELSLSELRAYISLRELSEYDN